MSLHVLAIDVTGDHGSIALVGERGIIEEAELASPDGFAHVLFPAIEGLLQRCGVRMDQIDAFASASGPGSFTGVRVGLTAVKGLAEASGKKAAAVSNLQAMAGYGSRPLRAVVLDARRGEIYGAVYDAALRPVQAEVVAKLSGWLASLPHGDLEFITRGSALSGLPRPALEAPSQLAGSIGRLALGQLIKGELLDPSEITANYIRRSDAELLWKDHFSCAKPPFSP
jgi:tRNA threonylcarbamoyladenosine biosynthesis protein TsaB